MPMNNENRTGMKNASILFISILAWIAILPIRESVSGKILFFNTGEERLRRPPNLTHQTSQEAITEFPMGNISFADSVISYDPGALGEGTGDEPDSAYQSADMGLGPPDTNTEKDTGYVSLGKGGFIILKFTNNVLIDGPGPDLHIFQREDAGERIHVWISEDCNIFIYIGEVSVENPDLDIGPYANPGTVYPYIKLRDDPDQGNPNTPALGADIDAVGAINTAVQIVIPCDELFRGKTASFTDAAHEKLSDIAEIIRQFPKIKVSIKAYTDNRGSSDFNLLVSQSQAESVSNHLYDVEHLTDIRYAVRGYGETNPVASNDTEDGRQRNRRMEILIQPEFN